MGTPDHLTTAISKLAILTACGIGLSIAFPDQIYCTLIVVIMFALDSVVAQSFRPVLWSMIGSVVAYLAMTLAYYVRQFAFPYHIPYLRQPLLVGHFILCSAAAFSPLLTLIRFYRPGSRRLAFATLCTLATGSFGYYLRERSTSWRRTLWMEYSSITWGCCIGAVIGTLLIGAYDFTHSSESQ